MPTFKEFTSGLTPPWLTDDYGRRWMEAVGDAHEALGERIKAAVKQRFPRYGSDGALAAVGEERSIPRVPGESTADYASRLEAAWDTWPRAGTAWGLLLALRAAGHTNARIFIPVGVAYELDAEGGLVITQLTSGGYSCSANAPPDFWSQFELHFLQDLPGLSFTLTGPTPAQVTTEQLVGVGAAPTLSPRAVCPPQQEWFIRTQITSTATDISVLTAPYAPTTEYAQEISTLEGALPPKMHGTASTPVGLDGRVYVQITKGFDYSGNPLDFRFQWSYDATTWSSELALFTGDGTVPTSVTVDPTGLTIDWWGEGEPYVAGDQWYWDTAGTTPVTESRYYHFQYSSDNGTTWSAELPMFDGSMAPISYPILRPASALFTGIDLVSWPADPAYLPGDTFLHHATPRQASVVDPPNDSVAARYVRALMLKWKWAAARCSRIVLYSSSAGLWGASPLNEQWGSASGNWGDSAVGYWDGI